MKTKKHLSAAAVCMGMLLQLIYWNTDILIIGILGYILFPLGLWMYTDAYIEERRKKD